MKRPEPKGIRPFHALLKIAMKTSLARNEAGLLCRQGLYKRETSLVAAIPELHGSADLGEESVVLANADIYARLDWCPALPNDNRAAGHNLTAKGLHSQALGI
jgi:hypothetical protein